MAILLRKLKKLNTKKTIMAIFVAGVAALILSTTFVAADGPQFNIFPISYTPAQNTDLPLLDARNVTKGGGYSTSQSDHDNGVQADPGDIVEFSVYYHNGAANADQNVAINTFVNAYINPSLGGNASSHTVSASVGAPNASTVSSANKGGNMTVYVSGSQPQSLSLVPGSVRLFRDCGLNNCNASSGQTLPDTIFSGGVSIGDVRGCFEFHGFVNFKIKVSSVAPTSNLLITKEVKNITKGTGYSDTEVIADPGNQVSYRIVVRASDVTPINNVYVRDVLDSRLSLVGSVVVDYYTVSASQFFSSPGVNIGTVSNSSVKSITFDAVVADAGQFNAGQTYTLPNTAYAKSDTQEVSDGANVKVAKAAQVISCTYTWELPRLSDGRGLRKVGDRANVTEDIKGLNPNQSFYLVNRHSSTGAIFRSPVQANSSGNYYKFDDTITPSSYTTGDYVSYIEVNGQKVADCTGFRIEALQPQIQCTFTYDAPLVSDGSQRGLRKVGDRANVREQVTGLQANQSFTILNRHVSGSPEIRSGTLYANSSGVYDYYDQTIISSAYTVGDYNSYIEAGGQTVSCRGFRIEAPAVQQLDVEKTVRNEYTGVGYVDQVDAAPSQRVTFKIVVSPQNSNTELGNVIVRDTLPSGGKLTYVIGTFAVNGVTQIEDGFFTGSGKSTGVLYPGSPKTITFQADVASASNFSVGCETLTNSSTATSGSLSDTDTASVRVCKEAPVKQPGSPGPRP